MNIDFSKWGPLTVLAVAAILVVLIGGIVVAILTHTTVQQYILVVENLAKYLGIGAAVGRGLHLGLTEYAKSSNPSYHGDPTDEHGADDHPN